MMPRARHAWPETPFRMLARFSGWRGAPSVMRAERSTAVPPYDKVGVEHTLRCGVAERVSGKVGDSAAGLLDHGLGRAGVPQAGRAEARVSIGGAFGHQAGLERAADGLKGVGAERFQPAGEGRAGMGAAAHHPPGDRKSTRLNSSHVRISYAVFCLKKKIR